MSRSFYFVFFVAASIFSLGLLMIFSTSSADVLDHDLAKNPHLATIRQLAYAFVGLGLGWGAYKVGWRTILETSPYLLVIITCFLVVTLIPGVGKMVNGSRRWIGIGSLSFQPSEFAKVLLPLYFIYRLSKIDCTIPLRFFSAVAFCLVPIFLVLLEPNNGTVLVMGASLAAVCFLCNVPYKFWAIPLVVCVVGGAVFAVNLPYVSARLKVYMNPELDIQGKGHQPHQAKIAAGSGGLLGKGPGNGWQKLSYLPEAQNDYIAAIFAEEFGFLGILVLIVLYMGLILGGVSLGMGEMGSEGAKVAGALVFLVGLQAFLNMGVVSGLLPTTGLNLPLFSQGGTSLLANCLLVGILLSVGTKNAALKV